MRVDQEKLKEDIVSLTQEKKEMKEIISQIRDEQQAKQEFDQSQARIMSVAGLKNVLKPISSIKTEFNFSSLQKKCSDINF